MLIIQAFIHVKPESVDDFAAACTANARASVGEPGCLRFDVLRQNDDPTRYVLHEVYVDQAALDAHKSTAHYETWRDTVADLQAEPRYGIKYSNVHPGENGWAK